jgi:hypothetical protein
MPYFKRRVKLKISSHMKNTIVDLDPSIKKQFLKLTIPRTFVYGEKSLPENTGEVGPDAPEPSELEAQY